MDSPWNLSRRGLVKLGLVSIGLPAVSNVLSSPVLAQDAGVEGGQKAEIGGRADEELFPATGLPRGGQLEIRLSASIYTSDPDQLEVAQRMRPFDLESWIAEWTRVAEKNEHLGERFASEGLKVTANEYFLRASNFYREACWPQPMSEARMLPTYKKMRETFDKAWQITRTPFERVQIHYEGKTLDGYFRKPNGPAGKRFPVVIPFQGADTMAEATIQGGASYGARAWPIWPWIFPARVGHCAYRTFTFRRIPSESPKP